MYPTPDKYVQINYNLPPLEYCREFLKSPMSVYKINGQSKDMITSALNMMQDCIASIEQTEKTHNQFSYGVIEKGLNILSQLIVENKNEKFFDKFIYDYTFLAHNVNMNTIKNDIIKNKCEHLERFSTKKETFNETLIMFNTITEKISQWRNFVPPSFKLSEHYLNVIKEE